MHAWSREFAEGDKVWSRAYRREEEKCVPGTIVKQSGLRSLEVESERGAEKRHSDQLKKSERTQGCQQPTPELERDFVQHEEPPDSGQQDTSTSSNSAVAAGPASLRRNPSRDRRPLGKLDVY